MPNKLEAIPRPPTDPTPPTISTTSPSPSPMTTTHISPPPPPTSSENSNVLSSRFPSLSGISKSNNPSLSSLSNRKHRPKSLNLSQKDSNSDVALRIVSPGLPPLNQEMKSTMIKSQRIELQQRHLIASINSSTNISSSPLSGSGGEEKSSPVVSTSTSTTTTTGTIGTAPPSTTYANASNPATAAFNSTKRNLTQMADELDLKLNAKSSTSSNGTSLKRAKVPAPLNLTSSVNSNQNIAPVIHSAPIRPHNHPYTQSVHSNRQSNPNLVQQRQLQQQQQRSSAFARQRSILSQQDRQFARRRLPPTIQRVQYVPMPNTQVIYSNFVPQQQPQQPYGYYASPSSYAMVAGGASTTTAMHPASRRYDVPYTSVASHFPRGVRYFPTPTPRYPYGYQPYSEHEVIDVDEAEGETDEEEVDEDDDDDDEDDGDDRNDNSDAKSMSVTDVYRGDVSRSAPIVSQPLSAQREHFRREDIEAAGRHQSSSDENHADEGQLNDEEDNGDEIERKKFEQQHQYYYYQQRQHLSSSNATTSKKHKKSSSTSASRLDYSSSVNNQIEAIKKGEIFGSINLMNESVFNFRIFKNSPNSTDQSSPATVGKPSSSSASSSTTAPIPSPDAEWISKEKAKFLKICETSWDKFVASKFPDAIAKPITTTTTSNSPSTAPNVAPQDTSKSDPSPSSA